MSNTYRAILSTAVAVFVVGLSGCGFVVDPLAALIGICGGLTGCALSPRDRITGAFAGAAVALIILSAVTPEDPGLELINGMHLPNS